MSAHPVSTDAPIDAHLAAALGGRPTIGLEEIDAVAALQTRHDRKYLLAADRLDDVLAAVAVPMRVLRIDDRIASPYRSTYFDTPDRFSYRQAARSRPARFKVRTRTYVATGSCWLEVKAARRGATRSRSASPTRPMPRRC